MISPSQPARCAAIYTVNESYLPCSRHCTILNVHFPLRPFPTPATSQPPHQVRFRSRYSSTRLPKRSPTVRRLVNAEHERSQFKSSGEYNITCTHSSSSSSSYSSALDPEFPTAALLSAFKANALPFDPKKAASIIDRCISLKEDSAPQTYQQSVSHGRILCEEFGISPSSLFLLGYVLSRSISPRAEKYYSATRNLLDMASQMGNPSATVYLYMQLKASKPSKTASVGALARREILERQYSARLDESVSITRDPAACHLLAEIHEAQKHYDQAKQYYQEAGEAGMGESWLNLGLLYKRGGEIGHSKESFRKAMELDTPQAFYEFVLLDYPALLNDERDDDEYGSLSKEHYFYLLKAATSGYIPAAHALGQYFHVYRNDNLMAKEWYMIAAADSEVQSMLKLGTILRREGRSDLADEWEKKARIGTVVGQAN